MLERYVAHRGGAKFALGSIGNGVPITCSRWFAHVRQRAV